MARPRMDPAERDRIRDQILAAATRVFADQGFAGAGMREIALQAEVFLPQLYQCFSDKRDLYDQCCARIFSRNMRLVAEACDPCPDPAGKIAAFTQTLARVMSGDTILLKLFQRQLLEQDEPGIDALTGHHFKAEFEQLAGWIATLTGPKGAELKAYAVYAFTTGMIQHRPMAALSQQHIPEIGDPPQIARFVLERVLPEVFGGKSISSGI